MYIIYDGRGEYDTDVAAVLEAVGSKRRQVRDALYEWRHHDAVLVEYDVDPSDNSLVNEKLIGHLRERRKALLAKCSP